MRGRGDADPLMLVEAGRATARAIPNAELTGRVAIVIDDLISTGTTMARVAAACRDHGAKRVDLAATHGLFVGGSPV